MWLLEKGEHFFLSIPHPSPGEVLNWLRWDHIPILELITAFRGIRHPTGQPRSKRRKGGKKPEDYGGEGDVW